MSELTAQPGSDNGHHASGSNIQAPQSPDLHTLTFWRVEGSLAALGAVRPVGYFTWNSHTYIGRWARRGAMLLSAVVRPFLYAGNRVFATRMLHTLLAGVTRDRLDLLGEEYFEYVLKKQLKPEGVARLRECVAAKGAANVVLVSQCRTLSHLAARPTRDMLVDFRSAISISLSKNSLPRSSRKRFRSGWKIDSRLMTIPSIKSPSCGCRRA